MKKKSQKQIVDDYDYVTNTTSAVDCTGLIPSLPQNEAELESYKEIYHYQSSLDDSQSQNPPLAVNKKRSFF